MLIPLIQNETLKIVRRKRFAVVIAILFAILALVTYSQYRRLREQQNRNRRAEIQQRVADFQNMMRGGGAPTRPTRGAGAGERAPPCSLPNATPSSKPA